jgi:hypothetical protein
LVGNFTFNTHKVAAMADEEEVQEKTGGKEEKSKGPKKKFEVKKWNAVALWAWGTSLLNLLGLTQRRHCGR